MYIAIFPAFFIKWVLFEVKVLLEIFQYFKRAQINGDKYIPN